MPDPSEFLCASNTGLGWAFGTSRTGASHFKNGLACQDAFALWSGSAGAEACIAVAVADGHGDRGAGALHRHAADEAVRRVHGHAAGGALAEVLRDLDGEVVLPRVDAGAGTSHGP